MVTIFNRGFVRRSLPVLLALVLGLLVAPQSSAHSAHAHLQATAHTTVVALPAVHTGHSAAPPAAADSVSPVDPAEQITARPRLLRTLTTGRTAGSRAPPSALV
jgi:hypothetical protein